MLILEIALGIVLGVILLGVLPYLLEALLAAVQNSIPALRGLVVNVLRVAIAIFFAIGGMALSLYWLSDVWGVMPWWLADLLGLFGGAIVGGLLIEKFLPEIKPQVPSD